MPKICGVEGCDRAIKCKGVCPMHYHRLQRYGDPLGGKYLIKPDNSGKCLISNCDEHAKHFGLCWKHYLRQHKYGDPEALKCSHNGAAKKYPEMAQILYGMKQRCNNPKEKNYKYYGGRGIKVCERWSGPYGLENFIKDMGVRPNNKTSGGRAFWSIDRINKDGNYCPENCRWATWWEQAKNQRRKNGTSKYTGVSYDTRKKCWCAYIDENGKQHRKYTSTEQEALKIRKQFEREFIKVEF